MSALLVALVISFPINGIRNELQALPPTWRMLVKIAQCEQPGKGWKGVAWKNTKNYSFYGGMGMTNLNWETFKRKGQPERMSDASIVEQLWAAHRLGRWVKKNYGNPWIAWTCYTNGSVK